METERSLFPLWLMTSTVSKLNNTDCISFEDFFDKVYESSSEENVPRRSPEDIVNEFLPIVENDRRKGVKYGKDI